MPTAHPQNTASVACSLGAAGLRAQEQRWAELLRRAGTRRVATPDGVSLTFHADPEHERELRALVAVENECCPWAHWDVGTDGDGGLVMHASTSGDGVAVLQSMFPPSAQPDARSANLG